MCDVQRLVTLASGVAVPLEPFLLYWRLSASGFRFALDDVGALMVSPHGALNDGDRAALREARDSIAQVLLAELGGNAPPPAGYVPGRYA